MDFKRIMNQSLHSHSTFRQLFVCTIVISILPIIALSIIWSNKIGNLILEELRRSYEQITVQYISGISEKLYQSYDSLKRISDNTIIVKTMTDKEYGGSDNPYIRGSNISTEVEKSIQAEGNLWMRNCMIYSGVEEIPVYGRRVTMKERLTYEFWYRKFLEAGQQRFSYKTFDGKNEILSVIQPIFLTDTRNLKRENIGFVKQDILMEKLFRPEDKNAAYDILILDDAGTVLYSSNPLHNTVTETYPQEELLKQGSILSGDTMIYGRNLSDYHLNVYLFFSLKEMNRAKNERMQNSLFLVIGAVIIAVFLIAWLFSRSFSVRVNRLVRKMQTAENGDLAVTGEIGGNDEISMLDRYFNQMIVKLDELIYKNYIQELKKKETELKNLQLQIHPHFLYNTLETISSIAAVNHVFIISELCEKLGDIFRYSLGKNYGEFVLIKQELTHVKNYVYIQKARFGERFDVSYRVPPQNENYQILRFVLQPLVENAIVHGMKPAPQRELIEISVFTENSKLIILMEDDGQGMSMEKVEYMNRYINDTDNSEDIKGIGIKNVNQRIKFSCGDEYGITVSGRERGGTCIRLELPLFLNGGYEYEL